jgi:alanine-glyoxylate transaminase/serine-glyoxylate transaminase/serine-pyruvate transaminase
LSNQTISIRVLLSFRFFKTGVLMLLNRGRTILSIPGPSVIPERVLNAMHQPSPNIYEGPLIEKTHEIRAMLKDVARTEHDVAIYIGNGHAAWEAALANTLSRGDKILVLVTGRFGFGWSDMAQVLGVECEVIDFGTDTCVDPAQVTEALIADKDKTIRAVLTVQTDTASSVQNDIHAIRMAIDAANHPALYMVDCIASLGVERHEMDNWGVDVMVSACQKGLMTPAGISFVYANPKARAARKSADCVTQYWDWDLRLTPEIFYQNFCGTAPTHHLLGLHEALLMLTKEEGMEDVWKRHEILSSAIWAAVDQWATVGNIRPNIADKSIRSRAVTAIHTANNDAKRLRVWCEQQAGVTLGIGLSLNREAQQAGDGLFRIGHMGHLNVHMVMGTLGAADAGLKALGIEHGRGALEAASRSLALPL